MLALVLVNPLDLNVEQPVGVEFDTGRRPDVVGKTRLVGPLDLAPLTAERGIVDERLEAAQLDEVRQPALADRLVEQLTQARVRPVRGSVAG